MAGYQYSVVFQNDSSMAATVCLYQTGAGLTVPGTVHSVAWLTKTAAPTTKIVFQWSTDYYFFWAETGKLGEAAMLTGSQMWAVGTLNQVTLTRAAGYYTFSNQIAGPDPKNYYINQDKSIPSNMASAGLGMAGQATFAVQAQPNFTLVFNPTPSYFIAFGNYTVGQVLDPSTIINPGSLVFPPNIFSLAATLNADNTWTIESLASKNAALVAAAQSLKPR
jgi:hypothetical protein